MEIPVDTEIEIEWSGGWNVFGEIDGGKDFFKVSYVHKEKDASELEILENILLKNGEEANKYKKYNCYEFDVKFKFKGPLNSNFYKIYYCPGMIKNGGKSLSIEYYDKTGQMVLNDLKITDSWIARFNKLQHVKKKLAFASSLLDRLGEESLLNDIAEDIITSIGKNINNDYLNPKIWNNLAEVKADGYYDGSDDAFGGGGARLKKKKKKSKKKKKKTRKRKSKRKKHKTKRRK